IELFEPKLVVSILLGKLLALEVKAIIVMRLLNTNAKKRKQKQMDEII
ncbi:20026_t:CDS:1, partial [Cetraspora pellucida]